MLYFFTAPLKWVVGRVGKKRWQVWWEKNTASDTRKISALDIVRGDIFSGSGYGIGYFT
ncbi:hypothetical protein G5B35_20060 [Parapusillimonas sp. SGNA-6]|uniref:hypothetical protein n=1 Tax=Parapedobacter sp. SGR-10 TaxID=2710879 RepID=UPI0013D819E4|nr:hypothetical protein [Parapedobacter sp. SGR-10]NGF56794.1 hypothetical protein [Parapedobacter sp. SGR-10]NGM89593.1 hypothetical protein [Parapusillimonas sp. SGNA-6]